MQRMRLEWRSRSRNSLLELKAYVLGKSRQKGFKRWAALAGALVTLVVFLAWRRPGVDRRGVLERLEEAKAKSELDFHRLLHYVQHPQTTCAKALFLGGQRDARGKLDGDKIVCQDPGPPLEPPCLVYSFGGNNEWSFEEDAEKIGCEVYTFDPSLPMKHHKHSSKIWFYRIGISHYSINRFVAEEMSMWRMRPLDEIMEALGHQGRRVDVLKLDVEGDEWNVLEDLLDKRLFKKINHLCVEVHLHSMNWLRKLKTLQRLEQEADMKFFSSRPNTVTRPRPVPGSTNRSEQLFYELAWYRDIAKT